MARQSSDDVSDIHEDIHGHQVVIGRPGMGKTALMSNVVQGVMDNIACKIEFKNKDLNRLCSEFEQKIINSGGRPLIFHEESHYHKK